MQTIYRRLTLVFLLSIPALAAQEMLIRFEQTERAHLDAFLKDHGGELKLVSREGNLYKWVTAQKTELHWNRNIVYAQPNHPIHLFESPSLIQHRPALIRSAHQLMEKDEAFFSKRIEDNPAIQDSYGSNDGIDPFLGKAWGLTSINAEKAWKNTSQGKDIVVAVTDSGIDYNHPDLSKNLWHNLAEEVDGKDNDGNGFIDDIIGWDFISNDNKPFDLTVSVGQLLFGGGNPGHGTHVSGVVAARLNNGLGAAGVAPQVRIMPIRLLSEKGSGDDEGAIKAIDYAVANGAHIINASWGGPKGGEHDQALLEAIERAEKKGIIFVAAAGNGRPKPGATAPTGYDNDSDPKPMIPASFLRKNIVSVAALDDKNNLATFSNWGAKSVRLGAPGVKIYSTVPGGKYQDTIIELGELKVNWDGTSMASPFVSGALALIWAQDKSLDAQGVIDLLIKNVIPVPGLKDKVVSAGRLSVGEIQ